MAALAGGSIHRVVGDENCWLEKALESPERALIAAQTQPFEHKAHAW